MQTRNLRRLIGPALLAAMAWMLCPALAPADDSPQKSFDNLRYTWTWPEDFDPNGKMTIRWSAEPETLNILTSKDYYASLIQGYCYEGLLDRQPDTTELTPGLATYWELSQVSTLFFPDDATAAKAAAALADGQVARAATIQKVAQDGVRLKVSLAEPGTSWEDPALKALAAAGVKPLGVTYVSFSFDRSKKFDGGAPVTLAEIGRRVQVALSEAGKSAAIRIEWDSTFAPVVWVCTGDAAAVHDALVSILRVGQKENVLGDVSENHDFRAVNQPTIRLTLREGVQWTDGTQTTARDVKLGFDLMTNPKIDAIRSANYYHDVLTFVVEDDYHITVTYKKPYFKALEVLGWIPIVPHTYAKRFEGMDLSGDEFAREFNQYRFLPDVSNGPYRLVKWDENQSIILERNDGYWARKPGLKQLTIRFIKDEVPAMVELKNGNLDYMGLTAEQWKNDTDDDAFKSRFYKVLYMPPQVGYRYIAWNMARDLFKDRRVRLAMTMCFDRQTMIRDYEYGLAIIRTGPFFPYGPQSNPDIKPWPYDLAKAKELLAEAGWTDSNNDGYLDKDGKRFMFTLKIPSGSQSYVKMCNLLAKSLESIGVEMKIEPFEWKVFEKFLDDRDYDAISLGWTGSLEDDPYQIWHSSQMANQGSNHVSFSNREADTLMEKARSEFDPRRRNAYYHRLHAILHAEQPYTFVSSGYSLLAVSKKIKCAGMPGGGIKVHSMGILQSEWYVPKANQ
jgi:peptide/nickel transport system substrate-binding protein